MKLMEKLSSCSGTLTKTKVRRKLKKLQNRREPKSFKNSDEEG